MLKVADRKLSPFDENPDSMGLPIHWISKVRVEHKKQRKQISSQRNFVTRLNRILSDKTVFISSLVMMASWAFILRENLIYASASVIGVLFYLVVVEELSYKYMKPSAELEHIFSVVLSVERVGDITIYETEPDEKGGQSRAQGLADQLHSYLTNSEFTDLIGADVFINHKTVKLLTMVTVADIEEAFSATK